MSLSEESVVQITFSTAQEVSDEILGGTIQFCRDAGYKQNIKILTFLWSAFLLSSKDELVEQGIVEDVLRCYIHSLSAIFPKLSADAEVRAQVESLHQHYWGKLCADFVSVCTDTEISAILQIAKRINDQGNDDLVEQLSADSTKSFSRVATSVRSSIYRILRKIDSGLAIQYKHVLDEFRVERSQEVNTAKQTQGNAPETNATAPTHSTATPLGMGWYKFLIYFGLFAGALLNFLYGINYVTGGVYFVESNGLITAEDVYDFYGEGLLFVDILFGLILIGLTVFGLLLRNKLAKFKPDAPQLLYYYYGVSAGASLLYSI